LTTTTDVENFPGYPDGVTGPEMMIDFKKQAERFGATILPGEPPRWTSPPGPLKVTIDNEKVIEADTVIISTGATAKYLGLPMKRNTWVKAYPLVPPATVSSTARKKVAVVGGGDTACEEATYLSGLADKVYMIVRKPYLRCLPNHARGG